MPLQIVRNDITKMKVDAIVNAANNSLRGGGDVFNCIHRAAGPELLKACRRLYGCETGGAKITKGYCLPCRYVIHAVGPVWYGGQYGEARLLASCYRTALALAKKFECESMAFPLISSGVHGYPRDQALKVAVNTIGAFLLDNDMTVYIVIFDRDAFQIEGGLFSDITAYIDSRYKKDRYIKERYTQKHIEDTKERVSSPKGDDLCARAAPKASMEPEVFYYISGSLKYALDHIDESFSEMLLRKIDESGMSDAQCYKKANIDRKLFSKIRSDKYYRPSKRTVLAFALALELPLPEMNEMLKKAGFALSHSSKFDIIVEYFVEHGNYNIFEINEALFAFDQSLIGA